MVVVLLGLTASTGPAFAEPGGVLPILKALQTSSSPHRTTLRRQLGKIIATRHPDGGQRLDGTWASGTQHSWRGGQTLRHAWLGDDGQHWSMQTNGRDGQAWYRETRGTDQLRDHTFKVGPRNKELLGRGFHVGETVRVKTMRSKGEVVSRSATVLPVPGGRLQRYSVDLPRK